ncbi:senescence-specific cysteine protease SAG39-like protein [Cinnamomum micranthum f. kanehirae]|uniref:Senescence-specific cysteine protease SAG39-like protein n=1 Tax=Cinnamomum micranthum f. kanehirae TaxID=337451 RepID=A0A443Q331_9MAGN|nr:senescence-specific cysteine protease SAG39-like protein [Cinnamomum micranthum f. kanehirae]
MSMAAAQEEEGTSEVMALLASSLQSMGVAAAQEEEGTSEETAAQEEEGTSEEIAAQEEEERTSEEFAAQEEGEGTSEEIEPDYKRSDLPMWERHEKWMASFGRVYKDEAEKARRLKIFTETVEYIESFNKQKDHSHYLGINEFADLTRSEFLRNYTMAHGVRRGKDGKEELYELNLYFSDDDEEKDSKNLKAESKSSIEE